MRLQSLRIAIFTERTPLSYKKIPIIKVSKYKSPLKILRKLGMKPPMPET